MSTLSASISDSLAGATRVQFGSARGLLRAAVTAGALAAPLALHMSPAAAQVVGYTYGFAAPDAQNVAVTIVDQQVSTGDLEAVVSGSPVTSDLEATGGTVTSSLDDNAIRATVDGNLTDPPNAIDLFSASSSGLIGGAALVQVQETGDGGVTDTDVFGRITGSAITQASTEVGNGSAISLAGNLISSDVDVNASVQTLQGDINPAFEAVVAGTEGWVTGASVDLTGFGAGFGIGTQGGLLVGSAQIVNTVDMGTAASAGTVFSSVDGNSSISTSVDGAYGDALSIDASGNTVEARFTGNQTDNLIDVGAGSAATLASSAGILSLQNATALGDGAGVAADRATALVDGSSVTASVNEDGQIFTSSTLSLGSNRVQAVSTANLAESDIAIAAGVSIRQPDEQSQANVVTLDRELFGVGDTLVAEGGLFVVGGQEAMDSDVVSIVQGGATFGASVSDDLSASTLSATDNDALALATGNSATASIAVAGASAFDSVVTATSLQTFEVSVGAVEAPVVTATADAAGIAVVAGAAGDSVAASTVSVDGNDVQSQAVANTSTTYDDVAGTFVPTISITASDISAATTSAGTPTTSATTLRSVDPAAGVLFGATAGVSALSVQAVTGELEPPLPVTVTATTSDATASLAVGGAGSSVSGSSFSLTETRLTSSATLNTERMAVTLAAANSLDASSAVALAQEATAATATALTSNADVVANLATDGSAAAGNTLVVGDADLADGVFAGNAIEANALGQSGVTALDVSAGTSITASGVIDTGVATPDGLNLDVSNDLESAAAAEMTVLTDQRLATAVVGATVTAPEISATVANGAAAFGTAASGNTVAVDGNRVAASARGNTVDNSLSFAAASVDMSGADLADAQENTNLATLGAVQEIDADSGPIGATVDGAGSITASVTGSTATSAVIGASVSTDANAVTAFASGNTATNRLDASGSALVMTGDTGVAAASLGAVDATDNDVELVGATVTGVLQSNAAAVSAAIGAATAFVIGTSLASTGDVTGASLSADANTVLAQARGSSATTTTTLAFSTIESSTVQAVSQDQSGAVSASLGNLVGAAGGATVSVTADGADSDLSGSSLSADRNTLGAELFGATSTATLSATATGSLESGSAAGGTSTLELGNTTLTEFEVTAEAEFVSVTRQAVAGAVTGQAYGASVAVSTDDIGGATVTADGNLLTSQATGARSTSTLALSAADLGAANADAAAASLLTDQALSDAVDSDIASSSVIVTVADLGSEATLANGTETVSASTNTLSALGTGLSGSNTLTATASGAQGDAIGGLASLDLDGSSSTTDVLSTATADQVLLSNQDVAATADLGIAADTITVQVNQTGAAVNGDTLSVDSNTILAQGTGATNANRLTSTSGTSSTASSLIVANQETAGALEVDATTALVDLSAAGTVDAATLSLTGNAVRSIASSLIGSNSLNVDAGGAISGTAPGTGDIDGTDTVDNIDAVAAYDAGIVSNQSIGDATATVASDVTGTTMSLNVTGAIGATTGSTLLADANTVSASASGASDANSLVLASDNALAAVTAGVLQQQESLGAVSAGVTGTEGSTVVELTAGAAVSASTLSASNNVLSASASNLTASNTLTADAGTAVSATAGDATNTLATANRGAATLTLAATQGDRIIAADQSVSDAGDVTAQVGTDPTVTISAAGLVSGNSTVTLDDNAMSASATVASTTNALANDAGTALASGAGIASIQDSAADATARLLDGDLAIALGGGVTDASVSLGSNELTATARGLKAANTLTAEAASIDGAATEAFSSTFDASGATNEATLVNSAFSQLSSVQQQDGAVGATVGQDTTNENSALTVAVTGAVTTSAVGLDANAVTAQAVGVSAANTVNQTASGAIAVGSGASLASVQELGAGATGATVTGLTMGTTVSTTVASSTLTVDDNAVLAAATGGTAANALSVSAGTSVSGGGTLSLVNDAGDTIASTLVQSASGDAILGSAQVSGSAVTATVQPGTDGAAADEFPSANLAASGPVTASTLSVDGNGFRALGTNLTATNTLSVSADTAISSYGAGVASLQDVNAATTGTLSGAQATLSAGDTLSGTASVSANMLVAAGTGGAATNSLTLSAADLSSAGVATAVSADLQGATTGAPITASGADLASGVSNIQTRNGAVTAQLTDGAPAGATGNLTVSATLTGAVTGTAAVDGNMLLAQARGLSATSALTATLANSLSDASLDVSSLQEAEGGAVTAAINAGSTPGADGDARVAISAPGGLTGTASLDGNVAQASALSNFATNTLSVAAAGVVDAGSSTAATIGFANAQDLDAATAGLSVMNGQLARSGTSATIDNFDVETEIAATGGSLVGTATVDGNLVIGDARNNLATNTLSASAANGLTASAALLNSQQSDATAAVSATINAGANAGRIGLTVSNSVDGTVSVSDNLVQGNAIANQALNRMVLNAATLAAAGGGSATAGTAGTADFVALNSQTSAAAVTTLLRGYTIGADVADGAGTFAGTARVDGNLILASAGGNLATNTFTVDAAGNARGDFVAASLQSNSGSISARIASMQIGLAAGVGAASATGTFSLDGNRIGATAQGNVINTRLGATGSTFSNF